MSRLAAHASALTCAVTPTPSSDPPSGTVGVSGVGTVGRQSAHRAAEDAEAMLIEVFDVVVRHHHGHDRRAGVLPPLMTAGGAARGRGDRGASADRQSWVGVPCIVAVKKL